MWFTGGTIHVDATRTTGALLVRGDAIADVDRDAPPDGATDVLDLEGGTLLASFGDGHAHPLFGGAESLGPIVRPCTSVAEIVDAVRDFAAAHPDSEWIVGGSYDGSLAPSGLFDARWLDEACPDRPVVLRAWDYHTVWCNSEALRRAGIDRRTPEPRLGQIPRRPDGTPLGTLREWGAVALLTDVMPSPSPEARLEALDLAADYYLARGVTWVQDAWVEPDDVEPYLRAAAADRLRMRTNLALYADPLGFDLEALVAARARVEAARHPLLTAHTIKLFADGVVENETGALLEPYCSGLHQHGMTVWPALDEAVAAADAAGFQVHIHAIGDAAVRQSLDAIERAIRDNPPRDRRPVIAHAQLIDPADLPRFAELGVIANVQPLWAQLDDLMTVLTVPRLGAQRAARQYPFRSLIELGTTLSFGSDWPVSTGDPLACLRVALHRSSAGAPAWTPHERIDLDAALRAYTEHVAVQGFGERTWGRLLPGMSADMVWLDGDPADPATTVRGTWLRGQRVS